MKKILSIILGVFLLVIPFTGCKDKEKDDATLYKLTVQDGVYSLKSDEETVFFYEIAELTKIECWKGLTASSPARFEDATSIQELINNLFADIDLRLNESEHSFTTTDYLRYSLYEEQGQLNLFIFVDTNGSVCVSVEDDFYVSEENACDYQLLYSFR